MSPTLGVFTDCLCARYRINYACMHVHCTCILRILYARTYVLYASTEPVPYAVGRWRTGRDGRRTRRIVYPNAAVWQFCGTRSISLIQARSLLHVRLSCYIHTRIAVAHGYCPGSNAGRCGVSAGSTAVTSNTVVSRENEVESRKIRRRAVSH